MNILQQCFVCEKPLEENENAYTDENRDFFVCDLCKQALERNDDTSRALIQRCYERGMMDIPTRFICALASYFRFFGLAVKTSVLIEVLEDESLKGQRIKSVAMHTHKEMLRLVENLMKEANLKYTMVDVPSGKILETTKDVH